MGYFLDLVQENKRKREKGDFQMNVSGSIEATQPIEFDAGDYLEWTDTVLGKAVKMEARLELVDKARAEELLSKQITNQRPVSKALVERLKEAMRNDEYISAIINPIFISEDGEVLDANHRLTAVHQTGIATLFLVVTGLPK